jgi:hypothetical protein
MMLREMLRNPAVTTAELGKLVGLDRKAVGYRQHRPPFLEAVSEMLMPAKQVLLTRAPAVTRRMVALAESADDAIAVRAGSALIRVLFPSKMELTGPEGAPLVTPAERPPITQDEIEKAKAVELKARAGTKSSKTD